MSLQIADRAIRRIQLIDDDPAIRESWMYPIEDLDVEPILEEGPIGNVDDYIARMKNEVDAVLCDHHLTIKSPYSDINGAELVGRFHQNGSPAILCTRYGDRIEEIRRFRKHIPIWLNPEDLNDTENITRGLEVCINEINGHYLPSRTPWRTLLRIEDIDDSISAENPYVEFVLPSWDRNHVIRMLRNDFPNEVRVKIEPGYRCHVEANIGAEDMEELYFDNWEVK